MSIITVLLITATITKKTAGTFVPLLVNLPISETAINHAV
jgi:hypothetical protein